MTFSRRFRESDFMKKMMFSILAIVFMLVLTACGSNKIDMTQPVFETENIKGVTVYSMPDFEEGIAVPDEDMDVVIQWLGSFRLDKEAGKAGDKLDPGTGIRSFAIEYLDGTIVESDAITITIDNTIYYMKSESRPVCIEELFAEKRAEADNEVLQYLSEKYGLQFMLWGPVENDLFVYHIYPDHADWECHILMPENTDDVEQYWNNLSWKIEDDELIIINEIGGEWTETFKIDISAETATSTRTGIVYQMHEMESPLE